MTQDIPFLLESDYGPGGDQPQAIQELVQGVEEQKKHQVLLGITGSGKTFTMANVIRELQRPSLVIAHNKTLAAQLFNEFKSFFPHNAVEYSSATTITTSLKPMFPTKIFTLKKIHR